MFQNFWGTFPQQTWGQKRAKLGSTLKINQNSIANISGTDGDVQNQKDVIDSDSSRVQENKSGELWSTNNKVGHMSLDPPKSTFWKTIFRSLGVLPHSSFYTRYGMTKAC